MSNQSKAIRQPSHNTITLSDGSTARVAPDRSGVALQTKHFNGPVILDANDAIRLAAFLNRFYIEQGQAEQREEAQAVARNRAARDRARHEATAARRAAAQAAK